MTGVSLSPGCAKEILEVFLSIHDFDQKGNGVFSFQSAFQRLLCFPFVVFYLLACHSELSLCHSELSPCHSELSPCHSELSPCHSERSEESRPLVFLKDFKDEILWALPSG
jgi:hypothetical protein